jgi:hypothetical protein
MPEFIVGKTLKPYQGLKPILCRLKTLSGIETRKPLFAEVGKTLKPYQGLKQVFIRRKNPNIRIAGLIHLRSEKP